MLFPPEAVLSGVNCIRVLNPPEFPSESHTLGKETQFWPMEKCKADR